MPTAMKIMTSKNILVIKLSNIIKNLYIHIKLLFDFGLIKYRYLDFMNDNSIYNYIIQKAHEVASMENIEVEYMPYLALNHGMLDSNSNGAVGRFVYAKNNKRQILSGKSYPRIELSSDILGIDNLPFVFIHELGHYFLYKRNEEQSEKKADMFTEEFFDKYLPPFFKWLCQIPIKVRCNKEFHFTKVQCYEHLQDYIKFKKNIEASSNVSN